MQTPEEPGEEMPVSPGQPSDGALLERDCSLTPNPDYALARDLLGMIMASYLDKLYEEEARETPDKALIKRYTAQIDSCVRRKAELHHLDRAAQLRAIEEYRAELDTVW